MRVEPAPGSVALLTGASAHPEVTLGGLSRLLGELSGSPRRVLALEELSHAEPGLEGRLTARVLPAIIRRARELPERLHLTTHVPLVPAHTRVPRPVVASWVAHLLLGTLTQPSPEHPRLDSAPLLASPYSWEQAKLRCVVEYFDRIGRRIHAS